MTFQLWINDQLDVAGCRSILTCKRNARAHAYNETAWGDKAVSTYHIRTDENSTILIGHFVGRGSRGRMKWSRP